jgi:enoyl-CoA hydratase/carnithine racemase
MVEFIGGGLELAAACHIRVADASAFFALKHAWHLRGRRRLCVRRSAARRFAVTDTMLTGRALDAAAAE